MPPKKRSGEGKQVESKAQTGKDRGATSGRTSEQKISSSPGENTTSGRGKRARANADTSEATEALTPLPLQHSLPGILDTSAFPHIFELIIDSSSPAALALLLRCSKQTFELAAKRLYRDLQVTPQQFASILDVVKSKSGRLVAFGQLGRCAPGRIRQALSCVRSIRFSTRTHGYGLATIPSGCLDLLHTVSLTSEASTYAALDRIFNTCRSLRQVLVRFPRSDLGSMVADLGYGNRSLKSATALMPISWSMTDSSNVKFYSGATVMSVLRVFLPRLSAAGTLLPCLSSTAWDRHFDTVLDIPAISVCIVGAEYYGYSANDLAARIEGYRSRRPRYVEGSLSFKTFIEWLEEQEPGVVFTAEEELELREADRVLLESAAALRQIHQ